MIKVIGRAATDGIDVADDPWIALDVSWNLATRADTLYLMVSGIEGGYVEFKVDSAEGALIELIVVDEPPEMPGYDRLPAVREEQSCSAPTVDLSTWAWRDTPDYSEPEEKVARVVSRLGMSVHGKYVTLRISDAAPVEFTGGGPVRVGLGADGDLACVVAMRK